MVGGEDVDEDITTFNTHFRRVPGLGLVAALTKRLAKQKGKV